MFTRLQAARLRSVFALGALLGALACGTARAADAPDADAAAAAAAAQPAATTTAPTPSTAAKATIARTVLADTSRPATFLKETVVTGSRYPRRYFESPQATSFLTQNQLRDIAPGVISDAFQQIPGADNAKDSPWEQRPVLRGLSGQRVLVLVDG